MIISLGSACRPTFQIKQYYEKKNIKAKSYPFDWTITPFSSLEMAMSKSFSPQESLKIENLKTNNVSSITDKKTKIIHHHDFHPDIIRKLVKESEEGILKNEEFIDLACKAKERFIHTYKNLDHLKLKQEKLLFVRWQRRGHPDKQFPFLFHGEDENSLTSIITNYLDHNNFVVAVVETWETKDSIEENQIIIKYEKNNNYIACVIKERKGYDGDGTNNFKGDSVSWSYLLDKICTEESIAL